MYLRGLEMRILLLNLCRKIRQSAVSENGSVSVLTIGLFVILLSTTLILTDISSIYLAKRSLSQATEAAVQRGMKNLDADSYYSGEYNLNRLIGNVVGDSESDPGIPIDCEKGLNDVRDVLSNWPTSNGARINLGTIVLTDYQCDGFQIYIESSASAKLPFSTPFVNFKEVEIETFAGGIGERADTHNYYGIDIG